MVVLGFYMALKNAVEGWRSCPIGLCPLVSPKEFYQGWPNKTDSIIMSNGVATIRMMFLMGEAGLYFPSDAECAFVETGQQMAGLVGQGVSGEALNVHAVCKLCGGFAFERVAVSKTSES